MTAASITVLLSCLIVMGCFSLLVMNIDYNLDNIGNLNEIVVFVDSDEKYEEGATVELSGGVTARDGRTFLGWSPTPEASGVLYKSSSDYTVNAMDSVAGRVTFYAIWGEEKEITEFTVEYNMRGVNISGDIPVDETVYSAGGTVTLPGNIVSKYTSSTFLGWSLNPRATLADFNAGDVYTIDASAAKSGKIIFYAVWSSMPSYTEYEIVYDANGVETNEELPTNSGLILSRIEENIKKLDNVADIKFVSKEEAFEEELENLSEYPGLVEMMKGDENPLRDSYVITYTDNNAVSTLEYQLANVDGIAKVRSRSDIAASIENLKNGVVVIFLWFMIILFAVSVFVIINTVRLAVFARRQEISLMRYVGATNWFIALPFVIEGVIVGLLSGSIAYLLQIYIYKYVQKMILSDYKIISMIDFGSVGVYMLAAFLFVGVLTGVIGSCISLRKYMKA